jgi:hypothetical protein
VYVGPEWPDWKAEKAVIVRKAAAPVTEFKLIDVQTAELFTRPTGTRGTADMLIVVEPATIAGEWTGALAVTEIIIPEGGTLPDGTEITPGTYSPEDCRAAAGEYGPIDPETEGALDQLEAGVPMTAIFTGTLEEPGTVSIVLEDGGDAQESPWRVEGSSIIFSIADDAGDIVFSGTVTDGVMSGSWQSSSEDGLEMRGVFSLTRAEG